MKRGAPGEHEEKEIANLSLEQLNKEIAKCLLGTQNSGTSQGSKSFFKRLVWLETQREKLHGIPAKKRDFRER
jgi:hypothetical protein